MKETGKASCQIVENGLVATLSTVFFYLVRSQRLFCFIQQSGSACDQFGNILFGFGQFAQISDDQLEPGDLVGSGMNVIRMNFAYRKMFG